MRYIGVRIFRKTNGKKISERRGQEGQGISFETFENPIDFIHKEVLGAWLVWMLIAGHVMAALYHHFVRKDRTLKKMTIDSSERLNN